MILSRPTGSIRRGGIAPLTALLLVPLLAMVAFAVDIGWITHTQNDLQSAADAAAMAGAGYLPDGWVQYYLPGQSSTNQAAILNAAQASVRTAAKNYASYNAAGGVSSLTLMDSDIEFGYTDPSSGSYTPLPFYSGYPNTVKVVMRRDATANGALGLFFGPVLGTSTVSLTATAAATIHTGNFNGPSPNSGPILILPMTYPVNQWGNFIATGQSPDGNTSFDANGNPQLQVYPSVKFTGNFGLLSLDQGNDGASTISGWINNGVPYSDLQQEISAGLLPLSSHNPSSGPDWKGDSGLRTSDIQAVNAQVGQTYLLPLFQPVNVGDPQTGAGFIAGTGQGTNYYYNIVQFVGIKIVPGTNNSVIVEPAAVVPPSALLTGVAPATAPPAGSGTPTTVFAAPKLTQ